MKRYLIIGNGVAGARAALKIRETDPKEKIVGCILLGETKGRAEILNAIERKFDVKALKDSMLKEGFDFKKLKES